MKGRVEHHQTLWCKVLLKLHKTHKVHLIIKCSTPSLSFKKLPDHLFTHFYVSIYIYLHIRTLFLECRLIIWELGNKRIGYIGFFLEYSHIVSLIVVL